mmetsp:Transcript_34055/g.71645  ORF Transcript_34055/g.71645 Transcript_34055/m.71645 type:complete len:336 (-) Transcript_34055:129-1136(-)
MFRNGRRGQFQRVVQIASLRRRREALSSPRAHQGLKGLRGGLELRGEIAAVLPAASLLGVPLPRRGGGGGGGAAQIQKRAGDPRRALFGVGRRGQFLLSQFRIGIGTIVSIVHAVHHGGRFGKVRRGALPRHPRIPRVAPMSSSPGDHPPRRAVHRSGLIGHGPQCLQLLALVHNRRRRRDGLGRRRRRGIQKFVVGLAIATSNGVKSAVRRGVVAATAGHRPPRGHGTRRRSRPRGHAAQYPPTTFGRHPSHHHPRPPRQNHGLVVVHLVRAGVLNGQVEFQGGVGRGRVELFGADDGAFDVEEAGGGAREGEGDEGWFGTEFVQDGGGHCCVS